LKVIPNDISASTSSRMFTPGALRPPSIFSTARSHSTTSNTQLPVLRNFQHCFQAQARPIPHVLHPSVEGCEEPDAPYTITFTERQYIVVEDAHEGPRWTTSLMYIFDQQQGRTTLCEHIFGKTLLMSAGSNKITVKGKDVSHMSAITLWLDITSRIRSITFLQNTSKKTRPKDIQLRVYGVWDTDRASRKSSILNLATELLSADDEQLNTDSSLSNQSHIALGNSPLSGTSIVTSKNRSKLGILRCTIEFTGSSSKTLFLSHIV
jgi:hypothetical protein